jgi:L-asparaginase/Glu-tRNA(Gln) amidotransferase subunit D
MVYAFPGATSDCLDGFIGKFKAIVVVAYGSGNVNENMYSSIKRVIEKGLRVALVTHCKYGGIYAEYGGIGGLIYVNILFNF